MNNTLEVSDATLAEIIESVWSTVLGLPVSLRNDPLCVQNARGLAVCVHIVGAWNGTVLYLPTEQFARASAALMLNVPIDTVSTDDIHDAAAELCNIVAGSLKGVLPGPSSLSLPMVAEGANYEVRIRKSRPLLRACFRCEGETLQVAVLESNQ
jgi:chemotaxis protein CheX